MPHSPKTLRLTDELGFSRVLVSGHEIVSRASNHEWLVLGLGPDPQALAASLPADARVRYLECPAIFERAGEDWRASIPAGWRRVESFDPLGEQNIILHEAAVRLFPGFWGAVRATLLLPRPAPADPIGRKTALLAAGKWSLIAPATAMALLDEGFAVRGAGRQELLTCLETCRPDLFLSVNFAGLDRYGEVQSILARAKVPVAVWCVDNPFHALSGVKTNAWKDLHLFVTDDWFLTPLERHGARSVHHLPLAAHPDFFQAAPDHPELADRLLFVGHSAFADKTAFFAGLSIREPLANEARDLLARGERPDFGWWAGRLGIEPFWPGPQARRAGLGAEQSGLAWRCDIIREASATGRLTVCGDTAWRDHIQAPFQSLPCVDYYGPLAGMYASAGFVVGASSFLLPHGLTQRHFDVWAAGGCLLTDNTPGLGIFPEELTRPVTFATARDIGKLAHGLENQRPGLIRAWRELIGREHTYRHRIRSILECIA